jgi:hypothetical protein
MFGGREARAWDISFFSSVNFTAVLSCTGVPPLAGTLSPEFEEIPTPAADPEDQDAPADRWVAASVYFSYQSSYNIRAACCRFFIDGHLQKSQPTPALQLIIFK